MVDRERHENTLDSLRFLYERGYHIVAFTLFLAIGFSSQIKKGRV
jgi:hypothetical protein